MKVYVKNNDVSKAIRILKKKLLIEGDTNNARKKEYFIPKSEQRKIDVAAGKKRWKKKRELMMHFIAQKF